MGRGELRYIYVRGRAGYTLGKSDFVQGIYFDTSSIFSSLLILLALTTRIGILVGCGVSVYMSIEFFLRYPKNSF